MAAAKAHAMTTERETKDLVFKRTGRRFTVVPLNGSELIKARRFGGDDEVTISMYSAALATVAIDGKSTGHVTDELTMKVRLDRFEGVELQWLMIRYGKLFALRDEDLGNESELEESLES